MGNVFFYNIKKTTDSDKNVIVSAEITGCRGDLPVIEIPAYVKDNGKEYMVTAIDKKAFLGKSMLKKVVIPNTVTSIGDWAFAQNEKLTEVVINGDVTFEKGVFSDCKSIEKIYIGENMSEDVAALVGATIYLLQAEYLFRDADIGDDLWINKWDQALNTFLNESDKAGYSNLVLCGEEDIQRSVTGYIADKKKVKIRLCLLRLLYNIGLDKSFEEKLINYVLKYTKGKESEESWLVLLEYYADNMKYLELYKRIKAIDICYIDEMIKDIGENYAETKAWLISQKSNEKKKDIFDSFSL